MLHEIAEDTSFTERRAAEAERELLEWKKAKFMQQRLGDDFDGLIVSVTKFGLFVELNELFIEGLVPLSTMAGDSYTYHENTRQIIGRAKPADLLDRRPRARAGGPRGSGPAQDSICASPASSLRARNGVTGKREAHPLRSACRLTSRPAIGSWPSSLSCSRSSPKRAP